MGGMKSLLNIINWFFIIFNIKKFNSRNSKKIMSIFPVNSKTWFKNSQGNICDINFDSGNKVKCEESKYEFSNPLSKKKYCCFHCNKVIKYDLHFYNNNIFCSDKCREKEFKNDMNDTEEICNIYDYYDENFDGILV
jgi:hypothetical protein